MQSYKEIRQKIFKIFEVVCNTPVSLILLFYSSKSRTTNNIARVLKFDSGASLDGKEHKLM